MARALKFRYGQSKVMTKWDEQCPMCDYVFTRSGLRRHMNRCRGRDIDTRKLPPEPRWTRWDRLHFSWLLWRGGVLPFRGLVRDTFVVFGFKRALGASPQPEGRT